MSGRLTKIRVLELKRSELVALLGARSCYSIARSDNEYIVQVVDKNKKRRKGQCFVLFVLINRANRSFK